MLIFRFIILFSFTTRIALQDLMLKKHISFLIPSSASALYSPPQNTQPALIGPLTCARASAAHRVTSRLCHVFSFLLVFTSNINIGIHYMSHGDAV